MTQKAQKRRCDGRRTGAMDLSRRSGRRRRAVYGRLVMCACAGFDWEWGKNGGLAAVCRGAFDVGGIGAGGDGGAGAAATGAGIGGGLAFRRGPGGLRLRRVAWCGAVVVDGSGLRAWAAGDVAGGGNGRSRGRAARRGVGAVCGWRRGIGKARRGGGLWAGVGRLFGVAGFQAFDDLDGG